MKKSTYRTCSHIKTHIHTYYLSEEQQLHFSFMSPIFLPYWIQNTSKPLKLFLFKKEKNNDKRQHNDYVVIACSFRIAIIMLNIRNLLLIWKSFNAVKSWKVFEDWDFQLQTILWVQYLLVYVRLYATMMMVMIMMTMLLLQSIFVLFFFYR